jgi:uncharacterized metal-binding protein YceD (DUF177 family)
MKKHHPTDPELSRPLQVDKISAGGMEERIVARPSERAALAARFGLLDLPMLEAYLNVDHAEGRMIAVTGRLSADVVQQCVVTLEPIASHIDDTINILYASAQLLDVGANPPHVDELDEDPPEPIVNGVIDLGELVAQHLAVALDPYPRKEGALLVNKTTEEPARGAVVTPFAMLNELAKKPKKS